MKDKLKMAIKASILAGKAIMEIYEGDDFGIETKDDESPLTKADRISNSIINDFLKPSGVPIISEENRLVDYIDRREWSQCWIVDPLDGTKEFIKKNGEFTVNIALIEKGRPKLGVIFAPAIDMLYFGIVPESKAYKCIEPDNEVEEVLRNAKELKPTKKGDRLKVVGSRSHLNQETLEFIKGLREKHGQNIEIVSKGSSLKFCLVAEGKADIYPRFAPTMEWDTAAGQAICEAVGLECIARDTGEAMTYNKQDLLNSHFSVSYER